MRTKRKVSLTIDEDLYIALDRVSKTHRIAKSQVAQEALRLWLKKETETLMAKGYEDMYEEDKALTDTTYEAQREVLS
jgi:metal-responsive CopG/Arc/MetJ family transcriptional regulator